MLVEHYKFAGNGIVKRIDRETYSIPMATVYFPLLPGKNEKEKTVYRPVAEFRLVHSGRQLD